MSQLISINLIDTRYLSWNISLIKDDLFHSIKQSGQLVPVLCVKKNDFYLLLDGLQRYQISKQLGNSSILAVVIDNESDLNQILFQLHRPLLFDSIILRLRFLNTIENLNSNINFDQFRLPNYSHIKKDIKRVCELDIRIQRFFYLKGYSLKEIMNIIHFSIDLVLMLINDDPFFSFSKRSFDQFVSAGSQLMKRHKWSVDQFLESIDYQESLDLDITPQQRLSQLLESLKALIHPTLFKKTNLISEKIIALQKSTGIAISYDPSLEEADILLSKKISSNADLTQLVVQLQTDNVRNEIVEVLNQL